jgi:hypothetical protein
MLGFNLLGMIMNPPLTLLLRVLTGVA